MKKVLAVILGGGRGTRLYPLTKYRSKPAVPVGAKYRLIDIPISNCLHSDISRIYVLTQFNSASLNKHVTRSYVFGAFSNGFVDVLAAEQTQDNMGWFQGTADAVRQHLYHLLHGARTDEIMILSGDHLYRMDYRAFIREHRAQGADISIAVKAVKRSDAGQFGILKTQPDQRIVDFFEKPQTDELLDFLRLAPEAVEKPGEEYLSSMGIYIFKRDVLKAALKGTQGEDFGRDIIPQAIKNYHVHAHMFDGYWEDIGTIGAFYRANLALTHHRPPFRFQSQDAPIYTHPRYLAGARVTGTCFDQALIGEGSFIIDAEVSHSVIGIRSIVHSRVRISNSIIMGADYYDSPADRKRNKEQGLPGIGIGPGTYIDGAIIDKNARIGANVRITNKSHVEEFDRDNYHIREGIVVIPKHAIIPDGTVI
jgi:glucose-1-phosphate adenylyltransferase